MLVTKYQYNISIVEGQKITAIFESVEISLKCPNECTSVTVKIKYNFYNLLVFRKCRLPRFFYINKIISTCCASGPTDVVNVECSDLLTGRMEEMLGNGTWGRLVSSVG